MCPARPFALLIALGVGVAISGADEARAWEHGPRSGLASIPGVVPTDGLVAYPSASHGGWYGMPAQAAFPGRPMPAYMGSLGYHGAPAWYRPGGHRVGLVRYIFGGYSGVMVPW